MNGKSRTKMVNFGTKPSKEKLSTWNTNEEIKPIPIKVELTPIVNLFNEEALDERYNVSSSKILDWFLPLYMKYCKVSLLVWGKKCVGFWVQEVLELSLQCNCIF